MAQRIEASMTRAGMTPAPRRLEQGLASKVAEALKAAARQRAAKLLLANVKGRFASSADGEYYAFADCDLRLIDAADGKVLLSFRAGPVKGGHISRSAAVRKAIDNCVAKMSARINE